MKRTALLSAAFIEGGLVMLLELSIPHVITPVMGNSIFIWATMISISVSSLALGYFLGGFLSKKIEKRQRILIGLFLIAALLIMSSWFSLVGLNSNSKLLGDFGWIYLSIGLGLIFPLICFGATTPVIVSMIQTENNFEAGKVYSISTFGGLIFALITGFLFIPEFGLSKTLLMAFFLTCTVLLILSRQGSNKLIFRLSLLITLVSLGLFTYNKEFPENENFQVIYYSEGLNGQLMVSDIKRDNGKDRILFINRMGQTWVNYNETQQNENSIWSYPNVITSIASVYPENSKTLLLGLGGGIVAKQLHLLAGLHVDAVELDPRIVDISYEYFKLPRTGIDVYTEDARTYLNRCEESYDLIVFDIFNGEIAPSHALSVEAFQKADHILNPNGLIVINFNGFTSGIEGKSGKVLVATLKRSGFKVKMIPSVEEKEEDRNILYVAYHKEPDWNKTRVTVNTPNGPFKLSEKIKNAVSDNLIVTDDNPIMEQLNIPAAKKWRESYYKNFTKKFKKEYGIFYIK